MILLTHRNAFKHELTLFEKVRHPNVVQFVGAVTQNVPMMIVSEYHPKVTFSFTPYQICPSLNIFWILGNNFFWLGCNFQGDLGSYLQKKGRLSPSKVLRFALDIARHVLFFCKIVFQF